MKHEQSISEDMDTLEQVPSAQNITELVPFAQDQMGGEGCFRPAGTGPARR